MIQTFKFIFNKIKSWLPSLFTSHEEWDHRDEFVAEIKRAMKEVKDNKEEENMDNLVKRIKKWGY